MLSEREIEEAHPEAFDFAFGNLPKAKRAEFNRHLSGCRYCQRVVDEYSDIGGIIKSLPPHVEPAADLEERTIAAMVAAMAQQRANTDQRPNAEDHAVTRLYPIPEINPPGEPETQVQPRPQLGPAVEAEAHRLRQVLDRPAVGARKSAPVGSEQGAQAAGGTRRRWRGGREGAAVPSAAWTASATSWAVSGSMAMLRRSSTRRTT